MTDVTINTRSRGWCFTINNPDEDAKRSLEQLYETTGATYLVFQVEEGKEGTTHIQGYIFFGARTRTFKQLKGWIQRAHIEAAKGTPQQNKDYCTKEDGRKEGPWEFGECPKQGKRSDLEEIQEKLKAGESMASIAENHFGSYCRYHKGFQQYQLLTSTKRNWEMEVTVYWGPSGVGKSRKLLDEYPDAYWKTKNSGQMQFWDGYLGEEVIVIDEFYGWLSYDYLLRLLDRYPMHLEVKHGTLPIAAKKIFFTSNKHPRDWYNYERLRVPGFDELQTNGVAANPLRRRIGAIHELTHPVTSATQVSSASIDLTQDDEQSPQRPTEGRALKRTKAFRVTEPNNLWEIYEQIDNQNDK